MNCCTSTLAQNQETAPHLCHNIKLIDHPFIFFTERISLRPVFVPAVLAEGFELNVLFPVLQELPLCPKIRFFVLPQLFHLGPNSCFVMGQVWGGWMLETYRHLQKMKRFWQNTHYPLWPLFEARFGGIKNDSSVKKVVMLTRTFSVSWDGFNTHST